MIRSIIERLRQKGHDRKETAIRFADTQNREEAFKAVDRGLQSVPLERIVGSVGRYQDFDGRFRLKNPAGSERYQKVVEALKSGACLPPVKLYQIKEDYYVLDGNHRVAASKQLGRASINARVLEFLPSKDTMENILYKERLDFMEKTGIKDLRLSVPGQYARLLDQIETHRQFLEKAGCGTIGFVQAAEDWYKTIYTPLASLITKGGLLKHFPGRSVADLYAYISFHQWVEKSGDFHYGIGISEAVPKNMEEFRKKMSGLKEEEYPEMRREITAFVLMNVSARKEHRIVEKLHALPEIREVHSVHGSIDIIAKVVLKRDLVSSDAETIGDFVHIIRQIPGVLGTQTLIPGYSRVKE